MWDASGLSLDELAEEGELDVIGHQVGRALDLPLLHEHLEMRHDLVLELLEPLVEFHVVLVGARVVVLPPSCLPPVRLRKFQGAIDLGVECAVPIASLAIEAYREHAGLDAELKKTAPFIIGRAENTLLALVAPGRAARNVTELRPREVVGEHNRGNSVESQCRECSGVTEERKGWDSGMARKRR